ncbi:MAG TPA: hypothetical protein VE325_05505 [Burkholderiales bacterium]|nr:hypothetical protein [Burkholderiales bacterium]
MLHFETEPRRGYLYVTLSGELEVASAEAALAEMFGIAARAHQSRILLDCSRVAGEWGPDERYAVGSFIAAEMERRANQFPERPRLAIYAVAPLMDPNRYTQTVATNRGALVRTSDSLQELLSWLGV